MSKSELICFKSSQFPTVGLIRKVMLFFAKTDQLLFTNLSVMQRYTYRVLQTIQMKLIFLCVWAERAVLDSAKTALKFKYEI